MTDNIKIKKVWEDVDFLQLEITCQSEYVCAYQLCYVGNEHLREISLKIQEYINKPDKECYVVFGSKSVDSTPAFSMKILKPNSSGRINIEVDMDIDDEENKVHTCCFYVKTELGLLETLGKRLVKLLDADIDHEISMYNY